MTTKEDNGAVPGKKRRLSKKERKALKKQKKQKSSIDPPSSEAIASTTTAASDNDYNLDSFETIPVPDHPSQEVLTAAAATHSKPAHLDHEDEGGSSSAVSTLGKWFPKALRIKSAVHYTNTGQLLLQDPTLTPADVQVTNPKASLVLFYQYTTSTWSQSRLLLIMTYLSQLARRRRNLGGRIRVAPEGVNATLSAIDLPNGQSAAATLRQLARDLQALDSCFAVTDFKYLDNLSADRHFKEFKILPVQELVFYGLSNEEGRGPGGVHLEARDHHEYLQKDNTVVIDVRNHYETILGRFDGQAQAQPSSQMSTTGGAVYMDPCMRKSTDFKSWLAQKETKEKLQDKKVLMYCTGGIRCERASAYLKEQLGDSVEGVFQLQGGIERYLQAFPDGGFWRGKNFVFDKREAVGVENPDGDGGVVRKVKAISAKMESDLPSRCCVCDCPWDRYVGKKKCFTCGIPVLMCDKCMSLKPEKTPGMELKVRCPLCVQEDIQIPASQVEYRENGIHVDNKKGAAGSVLKWGGGHGAKKKIERKAKRRLCQFGSECARKDCFFWHPERQKGTMDGKEHQNTVGRNTKKPKKIDLP